MCFVWFFKQTEIIFFTAVSFYLLIYLLTYLLGDRGSTVFKVLCYKSEGRWFDPS